MRSAAQVHNGCCDLTQAEAQCYIGSSDCPDYLRKAEKRLSEEIERVVNYLDPSSEAHITKVVENELIGKQVSRQSMQPVTAS